MPDEPKKSRKSIIVLAVVLLCALVAAWFVFKSQKTPNIAPIAALRLDSIDETNRVATLSDGGSHDPDGTLLSWRIAWGDGQEENLSSLPQKAAHTYATEGEYTISLWCVDNLGATSSPPAMTNITLDFLKRQKAIAADRLKEEEARKQAEAKREADRLKEEEARKQTERLEQERQKQLAAMEAQKAREQQELEQKRKAEAELARQKAQEAATPLPTPLAAALPDNPSSRKVIYTPTGRTLGEFQISKERTEGKGNDGNLLVILVTRCVNFPDTPIPISDWQIDGKGHIQAGRIRASLSPGRHEVSAIFKPKAGSQQTELKADVTVETNGECVVIPRQ
jgi:flagellar biosynthesis GTPase FlhF